VKTRPFFPIILGLLSLILFIIGCKKDQARRKNVLLIMIDDLNMDLGCYGNQIVESPNIDQLAAEGVQFQNAYCQFALCNPSRASLLTGLRPDSTNIKGLGGHFRDSLPNVITLPQMFRKNGYFTASIGKVFHMGVPDAIAQWKGDQIDTASWDTDISCWGYELNSNGYFYNATPWEEDSAGTGGAVSWLKAEKEPNIQHDYRVATETIRLMKAHQDEPFFIAPGFIRPHVPLVAPKKYFRMYEPEDIKLPPSLHNDRNDIPEPVLDMFGADFNISREEHRRAIRAYYACISFVDAQVGRILNALDSLNLRENTLVVLVSDHGYQLGEHGLWFKKFLFNESIQVPLIVSDPEIEERHGTKCEEIVELVDIYPTLADLFNIPLEEEKQGLSFAPLLHDPYQPWKEAAFIQTAQGNNITGRAVRTQHWTYIEWNEGNSGKELYYNDQDPHQFYNLADDRGYSETLERMQTLLDQGWKAALPD
jgi:uncharacterized sulfatase